MPVIFEEEPMVDVRGASGFPVARAAQSIGMCIHLCALLSAKICRCGRVSRRYPKLGRFRQAADTHAAGSECQPKRTLFDHVPWQIAALRHRRILGCADPLLSNLREL